MLLEGVETTVDLHDLGQVNPSWKGILSPLYDEGFVQKYIHEQFLENASHYVDVYQNVPHWKDLLGTASRHLALDPAGSPRILDLGSGGGNTVFALHELYPKARMIASDLSVPLLRILKANLERHHEAMSCAIVQMNAEQIVLRNDQMDLVVGGSILHHLFTPEKTLRECYRVLKPGGSAVFFEPFELGNQMLALIFKQLIRMNGRIFLRPRLGRDVVAFFEALCLDYRVRKGIDKSDPVYQHMDDKWLFTRGYFETTARSIGFRKVTIDSLHDPKDMFLNQVKTLLRLGLGKDGSALPEWAVALIRDSDEHFSEEMRAELLIEGCILLEK